MPDDIDSDMQKLIKSVESMRSQNSAEHGAMESKMSYMTSTMLWLKAKWERFFKHDLD